VQLAEAYMKEQGLFHTASTPEAVYSDTIDLDLTTVQPSLAGPTRPQDRVNLSEAKQSFTAALQVMLNRTAAAGVPVNAEATVPLTIDNTMTELRHGSVVIAAITSCTNTSNPSVMMAAGLLAKKAVERGLMTKPWVKTSLSPGSKVVTDYLIEAGLMRSLEALRFYLTGYGCQSCIGNSGPLPAPVSKGVDDNHLVVAAVLSGTRNFEGRVHPEVRANYLASPPLVVAYALAGRVDIDLYNEPLGLNPEGEPVYLRDVWPTQQEVNDAVAKSVRSDMFQ